MTLMAQRTKEDTMIRNHERSGAGRIVARRVLGLLAIASAIVLSPLQAQASAPQVVATIGVVAAYDVAITPNGAFAYVSSGHTVSVIDTSNNTVARTVAVGTIESNAYNIAITPNGAFAYVLNFNDGTVSVINTSSYTVVGAPITVGNGPYDIAITPNGAFAYVVNNFDSTVSVIDTSSNTVVDTVAFGDNTTRIAIAPNGAFAYVTLQGSSTVAVIDTSSNTVVRNIAVGNGPVGVAFTPNGAFAYVANLYDGTVSVINTSSNIVVGAPITVGTAPVDVAITPNGAFAYVTVQGGNTFGDTKVIVIDTSSNTVVHDVVVGTTPFSIAITPNNAFAYVTNGFDKVYVIATGIPPAPAMNGSGTATTTSNADGTTTYAIQQTSSTNTYAVTMPAGTTAVSITVSGSANAPAIALNVTMPAGATKSVSLPKGSGNNVCIRDIPNATLGGNGCSGGTIVTLPAATVTSPSSPIDCTTIAPLGCKIALVNGNATDGSHNVCVCKNAAGTVVTVGKLLHTAISMIADDDGDGVANDLDWCPNTNLAGPIPTSGTLNAGNLGDGSVNALGCNASQVLACKPGLNNGEKKFGVTSGSQNVFQSITTSNLTGWAQSCAQMYPAPTP